MIRVGDKVIWKSEEWEVYRIEEHKVSLRRTENGFGIGTNVDLRVLESGYYKRLYEQQKQRADELEDMLNKEVEESYQMENRWRTEIERADRAEKRWSELRDTIKSDLAEAEGYEDHNKAMDLIEVLDKMHDLEEENER